MAERVELDFRGSIDDCIPAGSHVVVAVSGGCDSMALLHLLHDVARPRRLTLAVAHLDHALRPGSEADRAFVEAAATALQLPCLADRREVARLRRRDESPEEAARRVRRGFLLEARQRCDATHIATGHTLDDQAETVLMRLARGVGPAALAGMQRCGPAPWVRPLLELRRVALRDWARRRAIEFRDDPTNDHEGFDRNRVRLRLMPTLTRTLNPRAAEHLVQAADRLRDDARYLDELAQQAFDAAVHRGRHGDLRLPDTALSGPTALAGRVARLALGQAGIDARRIGARHVEALLDLAAGPRGRELHLPGGIVARRPRRGEIRLGPRETEIC